MKVWVAVTYWAYTGGVDACAVFTSEADAEAWAGAQVRASGNDGADMFDVVEAEVDSP